MNRNSDIRRLPTLRLFKADASTALPLDYADGGVRAGLPTDPQDRIDDSLDLNTHLIRHPQQTFYASVVGDSMIEEGIEEDDILVVDRALEPQNGDLAVCRLDGEFTLKRLRITESGEVMLMPSNRNYRPIVVGEENELVVWGVVTHTIKRRR